jgi:hypothetical protein
VCPPIVPVIAIVVIAVGAALISAAYAVSPGTAARTAVAAGLVACAGTCAAVAIAAGSVPVLLAAIVFSVAALSLFYWDSLVESFDGMSEVIMGCFDRMRGTCNNRFPSPFFYPAAMSVGCATGVVLFVWVLYLSMDGPPDDRYVTHTIMALGALLLAVVCSAGVWLDLQNPRQPAPRPPRPERP